MNMKVAVNNSTTRALVAGGIILVGGVLGGTRGIAVGNTKVESTVLHECLNAVMALQMDDVEHLCCEISSLHQMKVEVNNSTTKALVAGGSILVCGVLGGIPGIAVGGVLGALFGWLTSNKFRPLPQILMELSPHQRQTLYDQVTFYLINLVWTNRAQLVTLVMGNATLQQQVTAALHNYVTRELGLTVRFGN